MDQVPLACLPIGADPKNNETELVAMTITADLHQNCFAVMNVPSGWKEQGVDMLECEAMGASVASRCIALPQ